MLEFWKNQKDNLFLYVPFIMAAGGASYFATAIEPHIPFAWMIAGILFAILCLWRTPTIIRAILVFIFGFCYACAYTNIIDTPVLNRDLHDVHITGHVSNIDYTTDKARIYIRVPAQELNINTDNFTTVRVSIDSEKLPSINDEITTTANLFMPGIADTPGGFDFARWSYFNGITATGYIDDFTITHPARHSTANNVRDFMHRRAQSVLVDGLVLGYKNTIPQGERKTWTAAGVGHIWSISGFHMTLIMGWLFALFYFIFRSIPYVVRRVPAKHIAMICAWFGLILYVVLSGASVATLRAFLMATIICVAALLGRSAFSLRNVALAFCIIFLINPFYIMTAGFQLSFSAIFGLVWFWGTVNPKLPDNKVIKAIYTALLTAIIASVFTAPFIAAHFYSVPLYSIIGNLVLLPIFSFLIMPLVILGAMCAIIGIHAPLHLADIIYNWSFSVANYISNLPGATITAPYISNTALCCIILGLMSIVLIKPLRLKENYIFGAIFILAGIITIWVSPKPLFFATADHELVAMVDNDTIVFNKSRASNHYFTFDNWKHFAGVPADTPNTRAKNDKGLFIFQSPKTTIAYVQKFTATQNNIVNLCTDDNVDFIVSYLNIRAPYCEHKILHGGFIMYENGEIIYQNPHRRWHNPH
ncbi:MAG: ComEC/Rec2 family competence protein [Alphaproteobacteria bacterium]|nr:ComEC/Rec2 family competence protein [Alphaproteobacteria bacterium]